MSDWKAIVLDYQKTKKQKEFVSYSVELIFKAVMDNFVVMPRTEVIMKMESEMNSAFTRIKPNLVVDPRIPRALYDNAKPKLDIIASKKTLIAESGFLKDAESVLQSLREKVGQPI